MVYGHSPIESFGGNFEGLGHTIHHFKQHGGSHQTAGLFAIAGGESGSTIRDIYLKQVEVKAGDEKFYVGGLVGNNGSSIINASVDGKVAGSYERAAVGGLVGQNAGLIDRSRSAASVCAPGVFSLAGGLSGTNLRGRTYQSFATGRVQSAGAAGGLAGATGNLMNSYATGPVEGDEAGGLVGESGNDLSPSYSLGTASGNCVGGFVGDDGSGDQLTTSYWDMDTSGVTDPAQGACFPANAPGITGLNDDQLKSGLPKGFDPKIWASNPNTNNGYPYLRANPPQ